MLIVAFFMQVHILGKLYYVMLSLVVAVGSSFISHIIIMGVLVFTGVNSL